MEKEVSRFLLRIYSILLQVIVYVIHCNYPVKSQCILYTADKGFSLEITTAVLELLFSYNSYLHVTCRETRYLPKYVIHSYLVEYRENVRMIVSTIVR